MNEDLSEIFDRILSNPAMFFSLLAVVFVVAVLILFRLRVFTYENGKFAVHLAGDRPRPDARAKNAKVDGNDSTIRVRKGGQLDKGVIKGDGSGIDIGGE